VAQAWSVAEVLRAYVEEVKGIRPTLLAEKQLAQGARKNST
jgi:glycogen debranching enzyme